MYCNTLTVHNGIWWIRYCLVHYFLLPFLCLLDSSNDGQYHLLLGMDLIQRHSQLNQVICSVHYHILSFYQNWVAGKSTKVSHNPFHLLHHVLSCLSRTTPSESVTGFLLYHLLSISGRTPYLNWISPIRLSQNDVSWYILSIIMTVFVHTTKSPYDSLMYCSYLAKWHIY